ncbi:MAG: hypothetical protein WCP24_03225 [bacterium]
MFTGHTLISLIITYRYFILFPIACVEGPFLALIVGFLVHLGYLELLPSFLIMIFGDLIPDSIYFYIGRKGSEKKLMEKYGARLKGVAGSFSILEKLWSEHPRKTMFFSKLAYGLSIPFLISAGLVKMPFKKFIIYTIPATLFQYGLLIIVGYYLGKSYVLVAQYVKYGYILIAIILVCFIAGYVYFVKRSRAELIKMEEEKNFQM